MHRIARHAAYCLAALTLAVGSLHAQLTTGPNLLVTVSWLNQHRHDPDLVILQVGPEAGYRSEHIAGSRFAATRDLSTPFQQGTLNLEMPPEAALQTALERYGISDGSRIVVVFDSEWVSPSTRVLFTLGYAGLGARSMMLDGGLAAWKRAGLPVTAEVPTVGPGHLTVHLLPSLIVDHDYVAAHAHAPHARLIDARTAEFYTGAAHADMLGGHIPGAVNIPFTSFNDDSMLTLPAAKIVERFREAGVQPGDTVVAYCHVGQQATAVLFAARLAGHPVKLYDGSFQDWSMRKLPTEGGN